MASLALYVGTAIAAALALLPDYPIAWLDGAFMTLFRCLRGPAACTPAEAPSVAFSLIHYGFALALLIAVPFLVGRWLGRRMRSHGHAAAWTVGGLFVIAGAIALETPHSIRPLWITALRPWVRVSAQWYWPMIWYRLDPLLDATRLAAVLPALLYGVSGGWNGDGKLMTTWPKGKQMC